MMRDHENDVVDPLFVGMTRPASALGVPYGALVVEGVFVVLVFLLTSNPLYLLLVAPIHGILTLVSAHDPGIFGCAWIWLQTTAKRRNLRVWGKISSVAPVSGDRMSK